jgi:hypothetical protein
MRPGDEQSRREDQAQAAMRGDQSEAGKPKPECAKLACPAWAEHWFFGFRISFEFRPSDFGFDTPFRHRTDQLPQAV